MLNVRLEPSQSPFGSFCVPFGSLWVLLGSFGSFWVNRRAPLSPAFSLHVFNHAAGATKFSGIFLIYLLNAIINNIK